MISLLIDTHSNDLNIIIYKNHELIKAVSESYNNQSKVLLPKIIETLTDCHIDIKDLSEIIVVNGPGSFTGVRIGVTVAKTLAYSLNTPIWSINSLVLKAIGTNEPHPYFTSISDNKGYYVGEFDCNNCLIGECFYVDKSSFEQLITTKKHVDNNKIKWELIFESNQLKKEDCYNIKPLYIKKIEVEK